jgi:hypothetical protein
LPPLASITDWAVSVSAACAALAALASWATVRQGRRDFLAARLPELEITVIEGLDTGAIKVHVVNHGQGPARNVKLAVIEGGAAIYGSLPPTGGLAGGESRMLMTAMSPASGQGEKAVVICLDVAGALHGWAAGGRHRRWKLSRPWNKRLNDEKVFQHFFPKVDVFEYPLVRFAVEG